MSAGRVRWWVGCLIFFTTLFLVVSDIWLFARDSTTTVSHTVSRWTGSSREAVASSMIGFVFGALLIHFTGWTSKPPDKEAGGMKPTEEGWHKKGGQNKSPTTQRPPAPKGSGSARCTSKPPDKEAGE